MIRWRTFLALLGILLVAGYLRLGHLDLVEFKLDEVTHCRLALDVLQGHLPVVGSTASVGIPKPAGMTYLLVLPLAVSRDPRIVTGFLALLNVAAVVGCFLLARRYFGLAVGLMSGLLFAVSPWAVLFSRKVFTADALPFFAVLLLAALFDALVGQKESRLILAFVWLACLLQITFSTLVLVPVMALLLLVYRARVRWRPLLLGSCCFFLIFVPYLYRDLTQGFANLKALVNTSQQPAQFSLKAVQHALRIISGANLHSLAGTAFQEFLAGRIPLGWLDVLEMVLLLGGVLYLAAEIWHDWRRRKGNLSARTIGYSLLLTWTLVPVLINIRPSVALHPHYFVVLYPAPYIIIALLVARVWQWGTTLKDRRAMAWSISVTLIVLIVSIAVWQVYNVLYLYRFVDTHDTAWGHGVPVKYALRAADTLRLLARGTGNRQVVVLAKGDRPSQATIPAVFRFLLEDDLSSRFVDARRAVVFTSSTLDTIYCLAPDVNDTPAAEWLARFAVPLPEETLPVRGGAQSYRFYLLPAGAVARITPEITSAEPALLANGVTLLGHQVWGEIGPGQTIRLILWWTAPQGVEGTNYHFFNHLVDEEGHRWGQEDGVGYRASAWQAGDLIVSWFDLQIAADAPSGPFWVRTGMYTYPDVTTVPVVDAQGQPMSDAVQWEVK